MNPIIIGRSQPTGVEEASPLLSRAFHAIPIMIAVSTGNGEEERL